MSDAITEAIFTQAPHGALAGLTFRLARPEHEDCFTALRDHLGNEGIAWFDLEALRAPTELLPRRRVPAPDQVHPEAVRHAKSEPMRQHWDALRCCCLLHLV